MEVVPHGARPQLQHGVGDGAAEHARVPGTQPRENLAVDALGAQKISVALQQCGAGRHGTHVITQ